MKRKHKRKGSTGAVTVFLTMILVPCIIVVCAFDDISRVQLSKAGASSSADLALYSLLADYDVDLKEYYGLVSSCQNIEQYFDKTETYFRGMMDAKGIPEEQSNLFTEYLHSLQNGNLKISDFLQVTVEEAEVNEAEQAQLGENPALIEDGIVEFMKYRGPASILSHIFERFTALDFSGISSDLDDNEKIVEKKKVYAEAEGELLEAALYSYIAVSQYEDAWKGDHPLAQKGYDGVAQDLSGLWEDLKQVTELTAKYYFADTDHLQKISFPNYNSNHVPGAPAEDVGVKVDGEDGSGYYLDAAHLQKALEGVGEIVDSARESMNTIVSRFPQYHQGDNPAVYLLEVQDVFQDSMELAVFSANIDLLLKKEADIQTAINMEPLPEGDDLPDGWQELLQQALKSIRDFKKIVSSADSGGYAANVQAYDACVSSHLNRIQQRGYTFASRFTGKEETFAGFASQIAGRMPKLRRVLRDLSNRLSIAVNGGKVMVNDREKQAVSLDELADLAQTYQNARTDWGAAADRYDTDYAKQESDEYHGITADSGEAPDQEQKQAREMKKLSAELAARIDRKAVQELKKRLTNIQKDLQSLLKAMDSFTYGGEKADTIQDADTLIHLGRTVMPQRSDRSLSRNEADAASYFRSLIQPGTKEVFRAPVISNAADGNQPDLAVQTPRLYQFLKSKFEGKAGQIEEGAEENQKRNDTYKQDADTKKEDALKVNEGMEGKGKDIEGGHGGRSVHAGTIISSIAGVVNNILNGGGDKLRDKVYVCEYIMDMFSYSTINLEEKGKKKDQQQNQGQNQDQDKKKKQSLTNREISEANNWANLGEAEYVLFGNSSIDQNLTESYLNIFGLREASNLVSGFVLFYHGNNATALAIEGIANAVMLATYGIVPVQLTKCVLIGVLATMESSYDLTQLKKGKPVVFYKSTDKEWHYAISGNGCSAGFSTSAQNTGTQEKGMYYSDYMYLFLMIGVNSSIYEDMLLRTGDLVEANMKIVKGEEYDLAKARSYFHLKAKVRVQPLMLTLPIVFSMDGVDPSGLLESKDWCTYEMDLFRGYS